MNLYTVKIKSADEFDHWGRYHVAAKNAKQALDKGYSKFYKEYTTSKNCLVTELTLVSEDF